MPDAPVQFERPSVPVPTGQTFGTEGSDRFTDSSLTEGRYYEMQGGSDQLNAGSGNDTITSASGYDLLSAGGGDDFIAAGDGFGALYGGEGNDTIVGGTGTFTLQDTQGANVIFGGAGNENISASGESTVTGGDGNDRFSLTLDTSGTTSGIVTDFTPDEDILSRITLELNSGDEGTLTPVDLADGRGVELYFGDALLMTVRGASAADLDGVPVIMNMNGGTYNGTADDDMVRTSDLADTVSGGAGDDFFSGGVNRGTEPDVLVGGAGNDTIVATGVSNLEYYDPEKPEGPNSLTLEPNEMIGGAGDDMLISSYNNTMTGGEGADIFAVERWERQDASVLEGAAPLITDFDPSEDLLYIDPPSSFSGNGTSEVPECMTITVWEDGTGADAAYNGTIIVRVAGGQDMTLDDLRVPAYGIGYELLGYH